MSSLRARTSSCRTTRTTLRLIARRRSARRSRTSTSSSASTRNGARLGLGLSLSLTESRRRGRFPRRLVDRAHLVDRVLRLFGVRDCLRARLRRGRRSRVGLRLAPLQRCSFQWRSSGFGPTVRTGSKRGNVATQRGRRMARNGLRGRFELVMFPTFVAFSVEMVYANRRGLFILPRAQSWHLLSLPLALHFLPLLHARIEPLPTRIARRSSDRSLLPFVVCAKRFGSLAGIVGETVAAP